MLLKYSKIDYKSQKSQNEKLPPANASITAFGIAKKTEFFVFKLFYIQFNISLKHSICCEETNVLRSEFCFFILPGKASF